MSFIGTKVTTPMPDGLLWPAVAVSELTVTKTIVINRNTGAPVEIDVSRFTALSIRTPKDGGPAYLALSTEVRDYGYRPVAMPRFTNIVGLDVDQNGALISLEEAMETHGVSYSKWAASNFEARNGVTAAADL